MCQSGHMANQEKARPGAAAAAGTRRFPRWCLGFPPVETAGDWTCPQCNDLQFARNAVCRRCGDGGEMVEIYWSERVHFHLGKGFLEWYCFGVVALNSLHQLSMSHWTEPGHFQVIFWHRCGGSKPTMETLGFGLPRKLCGAAAGSWGLVRSFEKAVWCKGANLQSHPITSMYGILTYIWLISMVNVGKYTSPMDAMGTELVSHSNLLR